MERISDSELDFLIDRLGGNKDLSWIRLSKKCNLEVISLLQELKERRAAEATSKQSLPVRTLNIGKSINRGNECLKI